jgi:hypothetical protein
MSSALESYRPAAALFATSVIWQRFFDVQHMHEAVVQFGGHPGIMVRSESHMDSDGDSKVVSWLCPLLATA